MTTITKKTRGWLYELKRSLGLIYDPDDYPNAPKPDFVPPPKKQTTTTTKVVADDVVYNARTGQYQRFVTDTVTDNSTDKKAVVTDKPTDKVTDKKSFVGQSSPTNDRQVTDTAADKTKIVADKSPTTDRQDTDSVPTKTETFSWEIMSTPTNVKDLNQVKSRTLTEDDRALLAERNLDEAKGQVIKEFWFKKIPRNIASQKLGVGYSVSIIGTYYAVFNNVLKGSESPTLQEK